MIAFTDPRWLLLVLLAPAAWVQWSRPGGPVPQRLKPKVALLRSAAVFMLVVALAGPEWVSRRSGMDIIVVVDASDSMQASVDELAATYYGAVREQLRAGDRAALILFGRDVIVSKPLQRSGDPALTVLPDPSGTDIARALRAAAALTETDRTARVLLISDGRETAGSGLDAAASLRPGGLPVDVVPHALEPAPDAWVEALLLPDAVSQGQAFTARAVLGSTHETDARVYLVRDDVIIDERWIRLASGRTLVEYPDLRQELGLSRYELRLEAPGDTVPQNNVGQGLVYGTGSPRVLLVTNTLEGDPLRLALAAQGIAVDVTTPGGLAADLASLASYQSVVLHNVAATQASSRQMEVLTDYTRHGGGLVILGGDRGFGLGGYAETPLDDLSPLQVNAPEHALVPSVAMVLVIDKSGSMGQRAGTANVTKLDLAKEAVIGVARSLGMQDLLGVVAFDSVPQWVVPLQPLGPLDWLTAQLLRLTADGGTHIYPALVDALDALRRTAAGVKHVILLSDGETLDADFESLVLHMHDQGMTVSTVAVGNANTTLMQNIARWGNGRYYYTDDPLRIPYIFAAETRIVSPPAYVEERVQPEVVSPSDVLPEVSGPLPALEGYNVTHAKSGATVHVALADGTPLLASWRYGLGRVVAFASGLNQRWSPDWLTWHAFAPMWAHVVRWTMRPEPAGPVAAGLDVRSGTGRLWLDALDTAGRYVNFLELVADIQTPDGTTVSLPVPQTGPGRYELAFPAPSDGTWTATIRALGGELLYPVTVASSQAYSAEYVIGPANEALLERIARMTSGLVLRGPEEIGRIWSTTREGRGRRPLWPWLLLAASFLFVTDLGLRYVPPGTWNDLKERWRARRRARSVPPGTLTDRVRSLREAEHTQEPADPRQQASRAAHAFLARRRKERAGSDEAPQRPPGT